MFKRYYLDFGLTSLIDSNDEYCLNELGKIKDFRGDDVEVKVDSEGYDIVNVKSWDGQRDYRVIDLVAIHSKGLVMPKENYNDVVAFVIDKNKKNARPENIGYRFKNGPLESKEHIGFFYVPSVPGIVINNKGDAIRLSTGEPIKWYLSKPSSKKNIKNGYRFNNARFAAYSYMPISRHRSLALAFIDFPDNVDNLVVNHKNGIPGDDRLENLEFITRRENNIHAYASDLKQQHKRVLVRNVLTGEVKEFYSISECSRALGWAVDETIRFRLYKAPFSAVFQDGFQFKLKDDERDWIIPENPEEALRKARFHVPVIVRNCETLEIKEYSSLSEASRNTGVDITTIKWRTDKGNKGPLFGYQFKLSIDAEEFPNFTKEEYLNSLKPSSFKVICRNHFTKEERVYESANEASKSLGASLAVVLRNGKQFLNAAGWQAKYAEDSWLEVENIEEEAYRLRRNIVARCEKTGDLIICDSAVEMAVHLGRDPKAIRAAAMTRGQKLYHGYRFRLGLTEEPWPLETSVS